MEEQIIDERFAKHLLRALYSLDRPIGEVGQCISALPPGPDRERLKTVIGDVMFIVLNDLMVPLYRLHPQLGRASEPGPWLNDTQ